MKYRVEFEKVRKDLRKLPNFILDKLRKWAQQIELLGMSEVRKISGYHDEPLKGKRVGQRSIRLSQSYRAIYLELPDNEIIIIEVIEVNKHEY